MIDFIEYHPEGFKVVRCFQNKLIIRSDFKYIQSLLHAENDGSITKSIKPIQRNCPMFINKDIILIAVPHKQAAFRSYINLKEIHNLSFYDNKIHITFYSGNYLEIKVQSKLVYKRIKQLLKIVQDA